MIGSLLKEAVIGKKHAVSRMTSTRFYPLLGGVTEIRHHRGTGSFFNFVGDVRQQKTSAEMQSMNTKNIRMQLQSGTAPAFGVKSVSVARHAFGTGLKRHHVSKRQHRLPLTVRASDGDKPQGSSKKEELVEGTLPLQRSFSGFTIVRFCAEKL